MENIKSLFMIIDNCMEKLDIRLKSHLNRVAYLTLEYAIRNKFDEKSTQNLVLSSYLHDIGIINTGKVSNLLKMENDTLIEHSAFGYIYLKYYAKGLLPSVMMYHHTPYSKIEGIKENEKYLANIVNIVDKMDFAIGHSFKINGGSEVSKCVEKYIEKYKDEFCENVLKEYKVLLDDELLKSCYDDSYSYHFMEYLNDIKISKDAYYSMLESLIYLIESHSVLTAGHSHITALTAKKIASLLEIDETTQTNLYYAGILHDIGKIAVPSSILKKPGNLTNEEYSIMKNHVEHSVDILKGNIPDEIYYPAIRHHENLTGTGYPFGTRELTIEDEILRISDLLAALAESRYYRDSLPIEKVISILEEDYNNGNSSDKAFNVVMDNINDLYDLVVKEQELRMKQYDNIIEIYEETVKDLDEIHSY